MFTGRLFLLLLASVSGVAQDNPQDVPRDVFILARVRAHMSHLLARLPNYTCLQTIERTRRLPGKRPELVDVVRLEVALVNGNELFAWPGSRKFEDARIVDMVKGGAISNGNFALHAKAVFQSQSPRFTFVGERILDNVRRTWKWDFAVPQKLSGYMLRSGEEEAVVGFHGSFWADAESLDAVRLEIVADDIPEKLKIQSAGDAVEYVRVNLSGEDYLLPSNSELRLTSPGGYESLNRTRFTGCRQYAGESTISFEDSQPSSHQQQAERTLDIPGGLRLAVELVTPVSDKDSAVGDPITAILKGSVKLGAGLVVPKGAFLHGRITHLRQQQDHPAGWVVGMTFFELEWLRTRGRLRAKLESVPALTLLSTAVPQYRSLARRLALEEGMFMAPGQRLLLRQGFAMEWRTEPLTAEDKQ